MDFELTEDQHELQRIVREIAEAECPTSLVRAVADDGETGEDRSWAAVDSLWRTFVKLDWPSLTVPEEDGGMGSTAVELAITVEELGRVGDPTPFLATTSQYVPLVRACGDAEQRHTLLAEVCAGGTGAASFDADAVTATRDGDRWRLAGTARWVMDGARADQVAVAAATDSGPAVFVVPAGSIAVERAPSFDATLQVAHVSLEGAVVGAERSLCGPHVAEGIERARREATTGLAASMVGASQRIMELAGEHVRSRHQFGQPIGAFQAVKHMFVDVYIAIERARALCHFAALTIAEDDPRAPLATSMAKAAAGDCQRISVQHGVQLFGGLGFTWENDLQLFVRKAKSGELLFGSTAQHRATVARLATAGALGTDTGEDR